MGDALRVIRVTLAEDPIATLVLRRGHETVEVRAAMGFSDLVEVCGSEAFLRLHGEKRINISALHAGEEVVVLPSHECYSRFAEVFDGR